MRAVAKAVSAAFMAAAMLGASSGVAHANNVMAQLAAECVDKGGWLESVKNGTGGWDHICHYEI